MLENFAMNKTLNARKPVVLIVEDDGMLAALTAECLEEAGFHTITANDADEAMVILASTPNIEIVFTDIDMPGPMNGLGLAEVIGVRWPDIRIAITSGHAMRDQAFPRGSIFFRKPYQERELLATFNRLAA
jgi:DNA-binding NtrC family response regulator